MAKFLCIRIGNISCHHEEYRPYSSALGAYVEDAIVGYYKDGDDTMRNKLCRKGREILAGMLRLKFGDPLVGVWYCRECKTRRYPNAIKHDYFEGMINFVDGTPMCVCCNHPLIYDEEG